MTDYKPTTNDIEWMAKSLAGVCDGGLLIMPSPKLAYRVSHKTKTLTRVDVFGYGGDQETHERTVATCLLIDWTVRDPKQN